MAASTMMTVTAAAVTPLDPGFARVVTHPEFLAGALVAVAVSSLTHEVLHFRYVWPLFGLVACLYLWARSDTAVRHDVGFAPATRGGRV